MARGKIMQQETIF